MIQISGGKSALWWEQKRQMSGGKRNKLGGGKSDKGKWQTILWQCTSRGIAVQWEVNTYKGSSSTWERAM